ncbi:hypothetical protein [Pseudomonas protegens]|uniref:hypothetical protein n=1 Tax=Pseudomonas protegens TaxID=380021 RepID=UPI000F4A163C|nr:hypothetical protein [Pseudomonas protegens]ROL93469.1 hypothetical protein BK639_13105 [Pseudomonas protegens]ROL97620.1 hypothetical protein BK640_25580 [Pseudomonas protegens]ROL99640.1 hypothetical protein BK641_23070 [Pseudomonas protegens]ROM11608.1 hypothetical protein BK642_09225 [Pseudomonas protegens]
MQLTYPKAPTHGVQTLHPALQAALRTQGFGVNRAFANAGTLSLSQAFRGYALSLEDLANGKGLNQATTGDWHYLVFAGGVSIADAQLTEVAGKVEFAALNHGALAASTISALNLAEQAPLLQGKSCELRLLFIPALQVTAIWLHAADAEVLIPIDPTPANLAAHQLYDAATLLSLLSPLARQAKAVFDADTSGTLGG